MNLEEALLLDVPTLSAQVEEDNGSPHFLNSHRTIKIAKDALSAMKVLQAEFKKLKAHQEIQSQLITGLCKEIGSR